MKHRTLLELIRFAIVGCGVALSYACAVWLLVEFAGLSPSIATLAALPLAGALSYFGHHGFTFALEGDHSFFLTRFAVQFLVMALATTGMTYAAERLHLHYLFATGGVILIGAAVGFLFMKYWVFVRKAPEHVTNGGAQS